MKKYISVALSVIILLISVLSATSVFAKNDIISPETTIPHVHITVTLNGKDSESTSYDVIDADKGIIHFKYKGKGQLIGWDFEYNEYTLVEDVDYKILEQNGNDLIVQILPGYKGENFWVNAVDKFPETTNPNDPTQETTNPNNSTQETTNPAKRNDDQKSPKTGASLTALGVTTSVGALIILLRKKHK